MPLTPPPAASGFARHLRAWRNRRRLSQLDLALNCGVSQRHLSFLESGRANPSRQMILQLSESLDVPLRERNDWLTAAGFAPVFRTRVLDDPQMGQVMAAVTMMLTAHEPYPAVAMDRAWNLLRNNRAFDRLEAAIGPEIWSRVGDGRRNLMRLFFHPAGIRNFVVNWAAVGPMVWRRAQREAEAAADPEMHAVLRELADLQSDEKLWSGAEAALLPVMPFIMAFGDTTLSLFAVVASFGTALDITADELRLETLFPADAQTERWLRSLDDGARR